MHTRELLPATFLEKEVGMKEKGEIWKYATTQSKEGADHV